MSGCFQPRCPGGAAGGCSECGSTCSAVPPWTLSLTETELNIDSEDKGIREQGKDHVSGSLRHTRVFVFCGKLSYIYVAV